MQFVPKGYLNTVGEASMGLGQTARTSKAVAIRETKPQPERVFSFYVKTNTQKHLFYFARLGGGGGIERKGCTRDLLQIDGAWHLKIIHKYIDINFICKVFN